MISFTSLGSYGRFGNQMFQYAALYSAAKRNNYAAILPPPRKDINPHNRYVLDEAFDNLTIQHDVFLPLSNRYDYQSTSFDSAIFSIADDTNLVGYFQSEKYFIEYAEDIRKEFSFKDSIRTTIDSELASMFDNEFLVSLHVRRGDYLLFEKTHPTCRFEYYQTALETMPKDSIVMVISDDINWCLENLNTLHPRMEFVNGRTQYQDMYLMTKCGGNIIANSSFSWWGAWLANTDNVVAPSKWFGEETNFDTSDIIPDRWRVI